MLNNLRRVSDSSFVIQQFLRTISSKWKRHYSSDKKNIQEYTVDIKTCGNIYDKWRKHNKFHKIPIGNLHFSVKYIDNFDDGCSKDARVVVGLHGAPGSYEDFNSLSLHLTKQKIRFIAPSFPDFKDYPPGIFRHSAEEKAQFVKDFLHAICVSKIDALVIHSSAVYPAVNLCLDKDPVIKSLIMLNPGTYSNQMLVAKYMKYMQFFCSACENPTFLKTFSLIAPVLIKLTKIPIRFENILDPLLSANTIVHADLPQMKEKFKALTQQKLPICIAFSQDDKLIKKKLSYELAFHLGAKKEEIEEYKEDGSLKKKGHHGSLLKVMSFEKGSHYVFWKHASIINEAVSDFILSNGN